MIDSIRETTILTPEQIKISAPAVYARQPKEAMSDRYVFVPTDRILDNFAEAGWYPTKAFQSKTKKDNVDERKHVIRLSNPEFQPVMKEVGSLSPEILLINSHNGTSGIRMEIGLFRLVCANGLIVRDTQFAQITKRHSGTDKEEIFRILYEAGNKFPDIWNKISEYKSINLSNRQRVDFAVKAIEYNWSEDSIITPEDILRPRRTADENEDLFSVMNVVQENIIKGGMSYINPRTHRPRHTRSIKNADRDIKVNMFLWAMMENYRTTGKFIVE